jgi:hypothetical protein
MVSIEFWYAQPDKPINLNVIYKNSFSYE